MTADPGLRERKKQATRAALSQAAWSLMMEQGLDAVTPEAIADAVEVSPRTFRNYFGSREEAILYGLVRQASSLAEAIRARPADEPVWDSLLHVMPDFVAAFIGRRENLLVLMQSVRDDPAMLAQHLVAFEAGHQLWAEAIAERTGADSRLDLAPRLLAGAAGLAVRTSIEIWAEAKTDALLADLIRESLSALRAGLPPSATTPTT